MRVALLSESAADEAALHLMVEGIVGQAVERVDLTVRLRGWPGTASILPVAIQQVYWRTDADVLIIVIDSDQTPIHSKSHLQAAEQKCRICHLIAMEADIRKKLKRRPIPNPLIVLYGQAVPSLEAWLLAPTDPHLSETAWRTGLEARKPPFNTRQLKARLFGAGIPSLEEQTVAMVQAASLACQRLEDLELRFPDGFAPLANSLKALAASHAPPTPLTP